MTLRVELDTCAVSDALDSLGLLGVVVGLLPLTGPARIAGPVRTVLLGPPGLEAPRSESHLGSAIVVSAAAGDIVVVAHQGRTDCAGWGGNLARAARKVGIAGVIVDGAVRDVDEARVFGVPLFAASATPRTARGRAVEYASDVVVVIAGVEVSPGDWVIADSTGVVFVRATDLAVVRAAAERIAAKEAAMAAAIDAGVPVTKVMGAEYEKLLQGKGDT